MGLAKLFLNRGVEAASVVDSPAFSLTKVMAVVAPLMTVLVTFVTGKLRTGTFTYGQITTMIVALVAFLAVTASADVLGRSMATAAAKKADGYTSAAQTNASARLHMAQFGTPLPAHLAQGGDAHEDVQVLAVSDANPPEFLCVRSDQTVSWAAASAITFKAQ
jgi:hypothetical protein